jgi:hypothetical protein
MAMAITRADGPTGEVSGVFVAEQLSDSDMGAKAPKKVPRAHTHAAAYKRSVPPFAGARARTQTLGLLSLIALLRRSYAFSW